MPGEKERYGRRPSYFGRCEICETAIIQKLTIGDDSDEHWDINFYDAQESGELGKSVPRNHFCSRECAIEGLKQGIPKKNTERQRERRSDLLDDN